MPNTTENDQNLQQILDWTTLSYNHQYIFFWPSDFPSYAPGCGACEQPVVQSAEAGGRPVLG